MRYCDKCRVSLTGHPLRCPLCGSDTSKTAEVDFPLLGPIGTPETAGFDGRSYPYLPFAVPPHIRLLRLLQLGSVAAAAVCVGINYLLPFQDWWSFFVVAGIVSFWLAFAMAIRKRRNIPQNLVWQTVLISLLAVIWDVSTGFRGWSVDYVLPFLCIGALICLSAWAKIKKLRTEDYLIYLIIDSIFGILPVLLLVLDLIRVPLPSVLCIIVSVISLSSLWLLEGNALRAEICRRLHL